MEDNRRVRRTVFEKYFSEQLYFGVGVCLILGIVLTVPPSMSSDVRVVGNVSFTPAYHIKANQTRILKNKNSKSRHQSKRTKTREEEALEAAVEDVTDEDYPDYLSTTPTSSGCSACRMREEMKNFSLAVIKEQILNKLGIVQFPNTTGRTLPKIPQVLMEKYRKNQHVPGMLGDEPVPKPGPVIHDEDDDYHARTEKVIAFAQPHPKLRHTGRGPILYFRFSDTIIRNKVLRAQLFVNLKGTKEHTHTIGTPITITVLRVLRNRNGSDIQLSHVTTEKVFKQNDAGGTWVSLDVKRLLVEWFHYPKDNLGIVIQASGPQDPFGRSLIVTDLEEGDGSLIPFLEVHVTDGRSRRIKRTVALNCDDKSDETRCCRYPLTVDFEAFGWDWIIAPKKYEANFCSGECPYVFLQKYPHTHIVHLASPEGMPGPCCAPRKLSSISMLYFDSEFNIVYGLLPGMVVDRCGCS